MRTLARLASTLVRSQEETGVDLLSGDVESLLADLAQRGLRTRVDFIHFPPHLLLPSRYGRRLIGTLSRTAAGTRRACFKRRTAETYPVRRLPPQELVAGPGGNPGQEIRRRRSPRPKVDIRSRLQRSSGIKIKLKIGKPTNLTRCYNSIKTCVGALEYPTNPSLSDRRCGRFCIRRSGQFIQAEKLRRTVRSGALRCPGNPDPHCREERCVLCKPGSSLHVSRGYRPLCLQPGGRLLTRKAELARTLGHPLLIAGLVWSRLRFVARFSQVSAYGG